MVDLIAVLVAAFCAFRGWLRGVLVSILSLAALVGAYVASGAVAPGLATSVAAHTSASVAWSYALARLGSGVLIFISLRIAASLLEQKLGRDRRGEVRSWNRRLGLLAGLVIGTFTALIFLLAADCYAKVSRNKQGRLAQAIERSFLRALVSRYNPTDRLMLDVLVRLYPHRNDPDVKSRLSEDDRIRFLLDNETLRSVLEDEELKQALSEKKVRDVLDNENLKALLADRDLRRQLFAPETRKALAEIADWADEHKGHGGPQDPGEQEP
jgi:hypothetical protein